MLVSADSFRLKKLPCFIVLDGVNGAGKTTLQKKLAEYFAAAGQKVHVTREPGATALGAQLRPIVLGSSQEKLSPLAETFLFAADRSEHVAKVIRPLVQAGTSVISDRYYYSTIAFQGFGRELNVEQITTINQIAIDGMLPDLTIILDLTPEEGLKRNKREVKDDDKFEHEQLAFHTRMRNGFLSTAKTVKEPCVIIDAHQSADAVFAAVRQMLDGAIKAK